MMMQAPKRQKRRHHSPEEQCAAPTTGNLLCLDDALLARVFKNLDLYPDVANVAGTCRRLARAAADRCRWLVVAPPGAPAPAGHGSGPRFAGLAAAVAASRPGDTIVLAPGVAHVAAAVRVRWPLHICGPLGVGAGGAPPPPLPLLVAPRGEAALDVTASAKVTGVRVAADRGPCILHRRGVLHVERCVLRAVNGGLDHLVAPIVTAAAGASGSSGGGSGARGRRGLAAQRRGVAGGGGSEQQQELPHNSDDAPGPGRLTVADTRLEGSSGVGVLCAGTGAVRDVRVVRGASRAWTWLRVDSAVPGRLPKGARPSPLLAAAAAPRGGLAGAGEGKHAEAWHGHQGFALHKVCPCDHKQEQQQQQQQTQTQTQQQHQRHQQQQALCPSSSLGQPPPAITGAAIASDPCPSRHDEAPAAALARVNAVLAQHAISPALLAAHLERRARQGVAQQQRRHQQQQ